MTDQAARYPHDDWLLSSPESDRRVRLFAEVVDLGIRSAPQQIASSVYASILDGSLPPGTRLPSEKEMAALFRVSKPTIREALKRLKAHGVIRASQGHQGGMIVTGVGPRALTVASRNHIHMMLGEEHVTNEQLREVRYELELLSAGLAAKHRSGEDLRSFRENEARRPGNGTVDVSVEAALQYDLTFHRLLARSSRNPIVVSFVSATIVTYRSFDLAEEPRTPAEIIAHLDDVLDAVVRQDVHAARGAMERHLRPTGGPWQHGALPRDGRGDTSSPPN